MSELVRALERRDRLAIEHQLGPEVIFHSPVRTYRNRDDVVHLLTTLASVLDEVRTVRTWSGPAGIVSVLELRVGERRLDGVLEEIQDPDTKTVEVTLMLRPVAAVLRAVERMGQALQAAPSPSPADRASPR